MSEVDAAALAPEAYGLNERQAAVARHMVANRSSATAAYQAVYGCRYETAKAAAGGIAGRDGFVAYREALHRPVVAGVRGRVAEVLDALAERALREYDEAPDRNAAAANFLKYVREYDLTRAFVDEKREEQAAAPPITIVVNGEPSPSDDLD